MYVIRKTTCYTKVPLNVVSYFKGCAYGIESYVGNIEYAMRFRTKDEATYCLRHFVQKRVCDKNEIIKVD